MDITRMLSGKTGSEQPAKSEGSGFSRQWKVTGSHLASNLPTVAAFKEAQLAKADANDKRVKIAAFDMDDTLICTRSGIKFGRGPRDWKWRTDSVVPVLEKTLKASGAVLVIFTNQASVSVTAHSIYTSKSYQNLTLKLGLMVSSLEKHPGIPQPLVFAATGRPAKTQKLRSSEEEHAHTRKPNLGMWEALEAYIARALGEEYTIDKDGSFFVGDAAGRDGDHSAVDSDFAKNAGVKFLLPEEFFGS